MTLSGVDVDEVPLMMDNDGRLYPSARGMVLRDFVRRDLTKLMEGLVTIDIRWKKIGDTMAKELADLLRKCPKVRSLDVQDNFISCIGCMEISKALCQHQRITSVNLSGNRIADLGAAVLSSMLTVNTSITHLDLSGNRLEQQAMQGIGGGLRGNTCLQTLLLDDNFFRDDGAIELGWAIQYNHTMRTLSIRGNVIFCAAGKCCFAGIPCVCSCVATLNKHLALTCWARTGDHERRGKPAGGWPEQKPGPCQSGPVRQCHLGQVLLQRPLKQTGRFGCQAPLTEQLAWSKRI
jgi:hypothetical protein